MTFDQTTLPNGLRIIGERIPHFRSASAGLWLGSGSQFESVEEAGVSHFLEHMVFKGTEKRTARQIAEEMDAVGGQLNAFTAKECTCFYTKVVDEHLPLAMDVIADLAVHPAFDPAEMEKEKGVVIEEIAMAEDTPEDLVHELIMLAHYGDQAISRPILGSEESVSGCSRERLRGYWSRMYRPQNAVLSVVRPPRAPLLQASIVLPRLTPLPMRRVSRTAVISSAGAAQGRPAASRAAVPTIKRFIFLTRD